MYLSCVSEIRVELATEYFYHILYTLIVPHYTHSLTHSMEQSPS